MSDLVTCQPGWLAVFEAVGAHGFTTEPIACWVLMTTIGEPVVHPICALGGDICDATQAANFVGVVGPNGDPKRLYEAWRTSRDEDKRSA